MKVLRLYLNNMNFSSNFLQHFPSNRLYHSIPRCQTNYRGLEWGIDEKQLIIDEIIVHGISQSKIAEYLDVNRNRITKLISKHNHGGNFSDTGGRSERIDEIGKENIAKTIINGKMNNKPVTSSESKELVKQEVVRFDIRRGSNGLCSTIHRDTAKKILNSIHASAERGQQMTNARCREKKDIRNMITMAVMNEAYATGKMPTMIGNFDATQFIISGKNEELLITIKNKYFETDNIDDLDDDPLTICSETTLSQAVKWIMLANASGHLSDDVFLISDSDMDDYDFKAYQIKGLSHTTDPTASGWLCFTKTRVGNVNFFTWYLTTIITDFVGKCRNILMASMENTEDFDDRFYLVADGEEIQLQPLEDDNVSNILESNKIDLGKGPAGCTNTVGNACDRSHLFKGGKKTLKCINSVTAVDFTDPLLEMAISNTIQRHNPNISSKKRQFISSGIVKIVKSLGKVVNFQIVKHGFERIGMYPLDAKKWISNCDKETLRQFDANSIDAMVSRIPELVQLFLDEENGGQLTEEELTNAEIPYVPNNDKRDAPKDARTQSQQRAVMLTNPAARKRRKEWIDNRNKKSCTISTSSDLSGIDQADGVGKKRKRRPNRPKEVIEEEKKQKALRKMSRQSEGV
jgi:transposase